MILKEQFRATLLAGLPIAEVSRFLNKLTHFRTYKGHVPFDGTVLGIELTRKDFAPGSWDYLLSAVIDVPDHIPLRAVKNAMLIWRRQIEKGQGPN